MTPRASGDADEIAALADATDVGGRVARLRGVRGLSLSELARRAQIGKATLWGLEAGTRNPTLETLQAVAAALRVPIITLVADADPAMAEPTHLRGTAVEVEIVRTFVDAGMTYEVCRLRIPAGAAQTSPAHQAGTTEHAMVFAGTLVAGPVGGAGRAGPGGHLEWRADVRHGYEAAGDVDVHASLVIRIPTAAGDPAGGPGADDAVTAYAAPSSPPSGRGCPAEEPRRRR